MSDEINNLENFFLTEYYMKTLLRLKLATYEDIVGLLWLRDEYIEDVMERIPCDE